MWRVVKHFFLVKHLISGPVCVYVFIVFVSLVSVFLFSLDSAFLSGVSVSPTCYFEPPPFMGLASPAVRNSVHNPTGPIQQCPAPHPTTLSLLLHQPAFTFVLTNMELFLFKCLSPCLT